MARTVSNIYATVYRTLEEDLDRKCIDYIKIDIKKTVWENVWDNVFDRVGIIRIDHNFDGWKKRNSTEEYDIAYSIVNDI